LRYVLRVFLAGTFLLPAGFIAGSRFVVRGSACAEISSPASTLDVLVWIAGNFGSFCFSLSAVPHAYHFTTVCERILGSAGLRE
jgi:hypothetical protein